MCSVLVDVCGVRRSADESDHIVDSEGYGEPVEVLKNGCDMVRFVNSQQNSGSTVLNELKFLQRIKSVRHHRDKKQFQMIFFNSIIL